MYNIAAVCGSSFEEEQEEGENSSEEWWIPSSEVALNYIISSTDRETIYRCVEMELCGGVGVRASLHVFWCLIVRKKTKEMCDFSPSYNVSMYKIC